MLQFSAAMMPNRLKKIAVIGDTGAGKTTFALLLAKQRGLPYISSDAYRFHAGVKRPDEEYLKDIEEATLGEAWVFDSAHTISGPVVWPRAEQIIYLKFPVYILLYRVLKRALWRLLTGERYDDGRKEDLAHLFGKDGWIRTLYPRLKEKRESYERQFDLIGRDALPLFVLQHPREVRKYLNDL